MKTLIRTALVAAAWICMLSSAQACDICGCSIGNNNPFLFPGASRQFIGLSYYSRTYRIHSEDGTKADLYASSLLLSAQYAIGNRFRIQAVLPFISNRYFSDAGKETKNGTGDLSLLLNYNVLSTTAGTTKHLVTLTAGVKLNTATATPSVNPPIAVADLQTGSGSTDYLFAAGYRITHNNWIAVVQAGYRYNTQDFKSGLRFGDVTSAAITIYRKIPFSAFTLTPYVTGNTDSRMDDARSHTLVKGSGGSVSLLGAGIDINTRKIAVGISCQSPVSQSLANGAIHESLRFNTHLFFTL